MVIDVSSLIVPISHSSLQPGDALYFIVRQKCIIRPGNAMNNASDAKILNLDRELLQILIVRNVLVHACPNHLLPFFAILLTPLLIFALFRQDFLQAIYQYWVALMETKSETYVCMSPWGEVLALDRVVVETYPL